MDSELMVETCAYSGCEQPVAPAPEGGGRPSSYCQQPGHNAQTAFRERRRRAGAGESDGEADHAGGERPSAWQRRRCARSLPVSPGIWSAPAKRSRC